MKISTETYNQLIDLVLKTKKDFKSRGVAIPTLSENGSVKIGRYTVGRNSTGYFILDNYKEVVFSSINLPQTALIIANSLALNQVVSRHILEQDARCGDIEFDELNFNRLTASLIRKKDTERYESLSIKHNAAQEKAEKARRDILRLFGKLQQLR
jgi:hypothetical protein